MTQVLKLIHNWDKSIFPKFATKGSACFDLPSYEEVDIYPNDVKLISTGIKAEVPEGYCLEIYPRSGFSIKNKLIIPNSPGIIDSDYRGIIHVGLLNLGELRVMVNVGDRIAQAKLVQLTDTIFRSVDSLSKTDRGSGGFGSTGK